MIELSGLASKNIVKAYDFSKFKFIADIGGGYGELLISILKESPGTSGILFDLPHSINSAKEHFE